MAARGKEYRPCAHGAVDSLHGWIPPEGLASEWGMQMTTKQTDLDRVASMVWQPADKITPYSFGVPRQLVKPMLSDRAKKAQTAAVVLPPSLGWAWRKTSIPRVENRKAAK